MFAEHQLVKGKRQDDYQCNDERNSPNHQKKIQDVRHKCCIMDCFGNGATLSDKGSYKAGYGCDDGSVVVQSVQRIWSDQLPDDSTKINQKRYGHPGKCCRDKPAC